MLRLACVILAVLSSTVAAAPEGRVVRIERQRIKQTAPILCEVKENLTGTCVGGDPQRGDMIAVVDEKRLLAEVRIESAKGSTNCPTVYEIKVELVRGALSRRSRAIGFVDPATDVRAARYVSDEKEMTIPNADPDTKSFAGIDRNGDGSADIVLAFARCPGVASTAGSSGIECLEIWAKQPNAKQMTKTWHANLRNCSP